METWFAAIYFNSTTKTVIDSKYDLDKSFQEMYLFMQFMNSRLDTLVQTLSDNSFIIYHKNLAVNN